METREFLLIVLPILSGIIGSYLTYFFTIKSKRNEAIFRNKDEKYTNLLILLQGFLGSTASAELKRKFFEEQYKSWIYCSGEVIRAINHMLLLAAESPGKDPDPKRGREAVGNIVLAMRKDLIGRTQLNHSDFTYRDVHS